MKKLLLVLISSILIITANAQNKHGNKSDTRTINMDGDDDAVTMTEDIHDQDLKQENTSFIYPGYRIKIHHFNVFNETFGNSPSNYNGDESQVILSNKGEFTTIRVRKDSVNINDDPNSNLESSIIQIMPSNKADIFKIYYLCRMELSKLVPHKSYEYTESSGPASFITEVTNKKITSSYNPLIPYAKYFYHIPKIESFIYEKNEGPAFEEIKTKLHAQERIITDNLAHEKIRALIYQNKLYTLNPKGICFRIERYVDRKCISTKYLEIDFEEYD